MKKLMVCLVAGLMLCAAPVATMAQETVDVDGVSATRVIIAPPQTDLARTIKAGLSDAYYDAPNAKAYAAAQKLYFFYGDRAFEPLWLTEDASGHVDYSVPAKKIMEVFKKAEFEGLRSSDYLTDALDVTGAQNDPKKMAALETAFSAATMRYAQDTYGGRVDPRTVSPNIDIKPRLLDQADLMVKLATSDTPDQILLALEPQHREFQALKAALAKFYDQDGTVDQQVQIPTGPTLKVGMVDDRVPLLRKRLEVPAADGNDAIYDQAVSDAVKAFQANLGLDADGAAGPATIASLNGGPTATKEDIVANMERWRWMPEDLGQFNVFVNIPEFRLAVMDGDNVTYTTRVVVGKPDTQTPIFSDNIRQIVVNPYWNVPQSIATKEIRPHLAANPGYLASQNMELLYGGKVVNAAMFDWSNTSIDNFLVRQKPGKSNSLGQIKFLFPNSHDVYLHDTPSKSLFSRSVRAFSHGCVRVQNPMDFADALLVNEPSHLNATKLEAMYGPNEKWVNMDQHVPVHIAYFTLRVDQDGTMRSYADIYGHNKKLIEMLGV
ncbi:MAG TPA: L,D-transpeptidase family protein [Devosiaceae bacterium]|jgi:murein L,D-transpeptidase YcbB/YkuD